MIMPGGALAPVAARSTGPVMVITPDALGTVSFAERAGFSAAVARDAEGLLPASNLQNLEVTFTPSNATFYDAPSENAAPMTVTEIADEYGLSTAEYASAEQYFESNGLVVSHVWPDRLSLGLNGTPAAVDRAFGTSILSGTYEGRAVSFPAAAPSLPPNLEAEVQSVTGLASGFDQFSLPELPEISPTVNGPAQNPANLVTPSIARDIYDV